MSWARSPLPERVLADEQLELGDELGARTKGEIALEALLERLEPKLLEPVDLWLGPPLVGELGQGRPPPERESFPQHPVRRRRAGGPRIRHELIEAKEVERTGIGTELVRRRRGPDHVATEHPPELGDVCLENLRGRRRRPAGPELLDQQVARNRLVRPDEQQGKQGPLLWRIQRNDTALGDHLKRTEDAELHATHARGRARYAQAPPACTCAVPALCRRSTVAQPSARTILCIGETTHGSERE